MALIKTERLYLAPVELGDAPFILELQNTPKWRQYIGDRGLKTTADAKLYIEAKMLSHFAEHGYGNYVVYQKQDDQKLGTCGLFNRPGLEVVDIGFALLPQFEGLGYGFEAAAALLKHAQHILKLKKVSAIVLPENKASEYLIRKLDLKYIKQIKLPEDDQPLNYYEIVLNK